MSLFLAIISPKIEAWWTLAGGLHLCPWENQFESDKEVRVRKSEKGEEDKMLVEKDVRKIFFREH